jgi:LuxR family transcriptional regulator, maltose regulon positive regulatory protein
MMWPVVHYLDSPYPAGRAALTRGETRVLRYLPTHLSAREIAGELSLSPNTVKTHQRHLYEKLGAHSRAQAVERARALGLLTRPAKGGVLAGQTGTLRSGNAVA